MRRQLRVPRSSGWPGNQLGDRAAGSGRSPAELARRQALRPKTLTSAERAAILALGDDLHQVWDAPATTDKDRKQLLHTPCWMK